MFFLSKLKSLGLTTFFSLGLLGLKAQSSGSKILCSQVLDEAGRGLAGVTVRVEGSYLALNTDGEGRFCLPESSLNQELVLEFSFIGYARQRHQGALQSSYALFKSAEDLDAYTMLGTRLSEQAPMTFENIDKTELRRNNLGLDFPMLLENSPSVVVNSDAGAGVGYTGLRIRGSDPTRINVSINGIPVNDAESQGVFWVNMPDFASSVQNVQIQRGVGSSTQGAGAFGASINLQTNAINALPYLELNNSFGSFGTRKHSILGGTGLIDGRWSADFRLSEIASEGFIDRASSRLRSFYVSGAWLGEKALVRANIFSGKEVTYQAWGGVPAAWLDSFPTYNPYTYDNEVDDYQQTHYQLHYTQEIGSKWVLNLAPHYTRGLGFFEQFRTNDRLSNYGLEPIELGSSTISRSDLIRRRWLDNHFMGLVYRLHYQEGGHRLTGGGGWSYYQGAHYGEVIWARFASNGDIRHRYYDNMGYKTDGNTYVQWQYLKGQSEWFVDVQHRFVDYRFLGFDNDLNNVTQAVQYHFFNPKLGYSQRLDPKQRVYASFSVANREPNRRDLTQSSPESRPLHEELYNLESGYEWRQNKGELKANFYLMYYRNQLVLNGQINDVGAFVRTNVPESYRLGLELQGRWRLRPDLELRGNASLSRNKVLAWTEFVDNWDNGQQVAIEHQQTDLAFSPNLMGNMELRYDLPSPKEHPVQLGLVTRYIGRQYLDNTQNKTRSLEAYWLQDLRLAYRMETQKIKHLELTALVRNLWNQRYAANGWTYRFISEGYDPRPDDPYVSVGEQAHFYQQIGLYPQAGIHFLLGLNLGF